MNTVATSSSKRSRTRKARVPMSYVSSVAALSEEGRKTHFLASLNTFRPLNFSPLAISNMFDNTCPRYRWLRRGWIVEERRIIFSGRVYRYYYDPKGVKYSTRWKMELRWAYNDQYVGERNRVAIVNDK